MTTMRNCPTCHQPVDAVPPAARMPLSELFYDPRLFEDCDCSGCRRGEYLPPSLEPWRFQEPLRRFSHTMFGLALGLLATDIAQAFVPVLHWPGLALGLAGALLGYRWARRRER